MAEREEPNRTEIQGAWTDRAAVIIGSMYSDYFRQHGGKPPGQYAFCWAGSGARREACPYSDIDAFIVLESDGQGGAFNAATRAVRARLDAMLAAEGAKKGFEFCRGGLNPLAEKKDGTKVIPESLTGTPATLSLIVEKYLQDSDSYKQHLVTGLCDSGLAFGNAGLAAQLRTQVNSVLGKTISPAETGKHSYTEKRRMALGKIHAFLNDAKMKPPPPSATRFDIKSQFYRVPQFLAQALAWWYDVDGITTNQQLNGLLDKEVIDRYYHTVFQIALDDPLTVRVKAHLRAGDEWEWARTPDHKPEPGEEDRDLVLKEAEVKRLRLAAEAVDILWNFGKEFYDRKTKTHGARIAPTLAKPGS